MRWRSWHKRTQDLTLTPEVSPEHLLYVYEIERQDHQVQGTIQLAIIGAGITYAGVIVGLLASIYAHNSHVPVGVLLLAPFPLFALSSFLILSSANSFQRAAYLVELEKRLEQIIIQPAGLSVPAGFRRSETVFDIRRASLSLKIMTAMAYASVFVVEVSLTAYILDLMPDDSWRCLGGGIYPVWGIFQVAAWRAAIGIGKIKFDLKTRCKD